MVYGDCGKLRNHCGNALATTLRPDFLMFNKSVELSEWNGSVYFLGNGLCEGSKIWRSLSSDIGEPIYVKKKKFFVPALCPIFL